MAPNWKKFQDKVKWMIEDGLGGEPCTITTPTSIIYDDDLGEIPNGTATTRNIKSALLKTSKDDLIEMPDGLRQKIHKKIYTTEPIVSYEKIVSDFDNTEYVIIVPSAAYNAGGLVHAYVTFLGKVETQSQ